MFLEPFTTNIAESLATPAMHYFAASNPVYRNLTAWTLLQLVSLDHSLHTHSFDANTLMRVLAAHDTSVP